MKVCNKCKEEKQFEFFPKDVKGKNGLCSICKTCTYKRQKEWVSKNKDKVNLKAQRYRLKNPDKIKTEREKNKEYYKKWRKDNLKNRCIYEKLLRDNNKLYKFKCSTRSLIGKYFKKRNQIKPQKTESILGCSIEFFKIYISKQFTKGMTFDNHGEWHLDHIIPMATAKTQEDVIRLNHYTNFQPLWAEENLKKSTKIITKQLVLI
jgi:hypothetical protein